MTKLYNRPMNFFEKIQVGWWWVLQIFEEWCYTMTHPEDSGGDFFCHLQTDYVAYEEDVYYD
jgi:hypothetical protein